jgi:hypothetical protein
MTPCHAGNFVARQLGTMTPGRSVSRRQQKLMEQAEAGRIAAQNRPKSYIR